MFSRILCVLISLLVVLSLCGCQESSAKTESQTVITEETVQGQSEQKEPAAPQNVSRLSWEENCTVEQATLAGKQALEKLGLGGYPDSQRTRTVRTRNPQTGQMVTRQVPISSNSASSKSDGLSGIAKGKSIDGTEYIVNISLMSPESCRLEITAIGSTHSKILKEHNQFIKQNISEAIQNPEPITVAEPQALTKKLVSEKGVDEVSNALLKWAKDMDFDYQTRGGDAFYKAFLFNTGSGISFNFSMRSIEPEKTQIEVNIRNYEGKDEFPMILKSLQEALTNITQGETTETAAIEAD